MLGGINLHQYKGRLIIHTGSMFSGKTSSLEKDINRFSIARFRTLAFKPSLDTRFREEKIVTHDNTKINAMIVEDVKEMMSHIESLDPEVVAIDEIQFLKGEVIEIVESIEKLLKEERTVVIAGLDMDFQGHPFEIVKELMPFADYLYKHHAVCVGCGSDAWVSNRKSKDEERIKIGASEVYEPLCRKCFYDRSL